MGQGRAQQVVDVRIAQGNGAVAAVAQFGGGGQPVFVEAGMNPVALLGLQEAAGFIGEAQGDGAALGRADAQNRQRKARIAVVGDFGQPVDAVGDQQNAALIHIGALKQLVRQRQRGAGVAAEHRHHVRGQGVQQVFDGSGVVGQRHDRMGIARVGHQRGKSLVAPAQHIGDLVLGPHQPRRRQIFGEHR